VAWQPLACFAAQRGRASILRTCLQAGAHFDRYLDRAALKGLINLSMFQLLYEVDWRSIRTSTGALQGLANSCTSKPADVLAAIYEHGAHATPGSLTTAILTDLSLRSITVMLEEGGMKERLKGSRALQLAARKGHLETVKMLLDIGADIDEIPPELDFRAAGPYQALFEAVKAGHADVVELLLRKGSRPDLDNGNFYLVKNGTALDCALRKGNMHIIQLLEGTTL
jgi:hypothetical protein